MYFHTTTKFHSFIYKPHSVITHFEAISQEPPYWIDGLYGESIRARVAYTRINTMENIGYVKASLGNFFQTSFCVSGVSDDY